MPKGAELLAQPTIEPKVEPNVEPTVEPTVAPVPKGAESVVEPAAEPVPKGAASEADQPQDSSVPKGAAASSGSDDPGESLPPAAKRSRSGSITERTPPTLVPMMTAYDDTASIGIVIIGGIPGSGCRTATDGTRQYFESHGYAVDTIWTGHYLRRAAKCAVCHSNNATFGMPPAPTSARHNYGDTQ